MRLTRAMVSDRLCGACLRLRDRSPVPIAAGENESGRLEFAPWIERRALDYYQVDLGVTMIDLPALAASTQSSLVLQSLISPTPTFSLCAGKCGVTDSVEIRKRVEDAGGVIINHCCA